MEEQKFVLTEKVQLGKQVMKDEFGNTWIVSINETVAITPRKNIPQNNQQHSVIVFYFGNIILKPSKEGILKKAEKMQIKMEMKNVVQSVFSSAFPPSTIVAKHLEGGIFTFNTSSPTSRASNFSLHVEFPKFTQADLNSSKDHLKHLLETGEFSDVTIKTTDKDINAHKFMLMRYEYYERMFKSNTKEAETGVIESGHSYDVMIEFCRYIYYEECNFNDYALELMEIADQYEANDLLFMCEKYLAQKLTIENFYEMIKITEKIVRAENLKEDAVQFFIKNQIQLITNKEWSEFKEDKAYCRIAMFLMEKYSFFMHEKNKIDNAFSASSSNKRITRDFPGIFMSGLADDNF